ncbi:MAG: fibronectin type III domain-containing protein, partial [Thermodesulfobacteriota bacterium]|nr:fibronectin type III domain-containing protein [Thermodesulfobacteriota bacterium]
MIAKSDTGGYAFGVSISERFLFLSEGTAGLRIFDISSEQDLLRQVGGQDTEGQALDASAYESVVVVADGRAGTSIIRDTLPPGKVTSVTSVPDKETWFSDGSVTVTWTPADDPGTGVPGYSIVWDTSPDTLPDTTQDIGTESSTTIDSLPDGTHYFHIRAVDNAGNWGEPEHWGPFYVGTAPTFKEVIPHANAGIDDDMRVSNNASFCIRIRNPNGIDMTNTENIGFMISDGTETYERDLSDRGVVRWVKLTNEHDSQVHLWAVYDTSREEFGSYPYDSDIDVEVEVNDRSQGSPTRALFIFHVETEMQHDEALAGSPETAPLSAGDPDLEGYDTGIEAIDAALLKGGKIVYGSREPVEPAFGPTDEIPELDLPNVEPVGIPLNLQPPTVFNTPVKILVPCPDTNNVPDLAVYFFNGVSWQLACDPNGSVTPEAEAWMVPGSRVNHSDANPPRVEIKAYHFTSVQAGYPDGSPSGDSGGGGGCFVATAA